ncbi:MAG: peptidase M1 [Kofleriaceae bacterium]|nr:peptidase M1 [Kofleriaceae bacterium]MBP6841101.1 peptidase M1 [Kofleriaceae bacterium]MBP9203430.1 peptidase M1 [Kofleriaceae bacterium]
MRRCLALALTLLPLALAVLGPAAGCAAEDPGADDLAGGGKADDDSTLDVTSTELAIDLASRTGTAVIDLARAGTVALEVGDLDIVAVRDGRGNRRFSVDGGRLRVTSVRPPMTVEYGFREHAMADGLLPGGSTVLWPYFCGNLFPCNSAPRDGGTLALDLTGVPAGQRAIFPAAIATDAPAYQLAWAVGDYTTQALGTTPAGTRVNVSWLPGGKTTALAGTRNLVDAFDWFERTLGPYRFGDDVGSVSVVWGEGMYGGMEHHPYWHVAKDAMGDEETHVHEAAHGWYGDGVRLRCWEDFVLSEGTVSYLTARAIGQVAGAARERAVWAGYQDELDAAVAERDHAAWPAGCGAVDILRDGLFSNIPYMKGAFFYKAVAEQVGADVLDAVLARFYLDHGGGAAGMQDMLDAIVRDTGFDPGPLAQQWLRTPR